MTTSQARGVKHDTAQRRERRGRIFRLIRISSSATPRCSASCGCRTCAIPARPSAWSSARWQVLRERNQALERKLKELVDVARANDALSERIHRLTQRLFGAGSLPETIGAAEASLREDFDARNSVLLLFLEAARARAQPLPAICGPEQCGRKSFESLLQSGKPRCGQVRDARARFSLRQDCVEIGSVALVPLGPKGALGGSRSARTMRRVSIRE